MKKGIWIDKIKNTYPYISKNMEADVCIVGGGICGAITAFFLAKDGFKVIVIDKNIIGHVNTCISSACITDFIDGLYVRNKELERKLYELKKKTNALLDEILVDIGMQEYIPRVDYNVHNLKLFQKGVLNQEMKIRGRLGDKIEKDEKGNYSIYHGARIIDPYLLTTKIFEYLNTFPNVSIYENTELVKFIPSYDYVTIITQNDFRIVCNALIITTSINDLPISNLSNIDVYRRFSVSLNTNITGKEQVIKILNDIPLYIRINKDGKVVISGIDTKYNIKMNNPKVISALESDNKRKLLNVLAKMYPKYEFAESIEINSGNILSTKDNLPLITEIPNMSNVYVNIGIGSSSISHMLIGADILKDAIKGYYKKEMNLFKIIR